ncbi:DUF5872 domain-containing protein [Methylobacterium sp. JK268]
MAGTAKKSDPKLWDRVKDKVTRSSKGGKPGQWSARKAQLAVHDYKEAGGGYEGKKTSDNHLTQWTEEEWGTKSGEKSGETGERYLPKAAREGLSGKDYARTTAKKRSDTAKGKQFSRQPKDVAEKAAPARRHPATGRTKADLLKAARAKNIPGRSSMSKSELERALGGR